MYVYTTVLSVEPYQSKADGRHYWVVTFDRAAKTRIPKSRYTYEELAGYIGKEVVVKMRLETAMFNDRLFWVTHFEPEQTTRRAYPEERLPSFIPPTVKAICQKINYIYPQNNP